MDQDKLAKSEIFSLDLIFPVVNIAVVVENSRLLVFIALTELS